MAAQTVSTELGLGLPQVHNYQVQTHYPSLVASSSQAPYAEPPGAIPSSNYLVPHTELERKWPSYQQGFPHHEASSSSAVQVPRPLLPRIIPQDNVQVRTVTAEPVPPTAVIAQPEILLTPGLDKSFESLFQTVDGEKAMVLPNDVELVTSDWFDEFYDVITKYIKNNRKSARGKLPLTPDGLQQYLNGNDELLKPTGLFHRAQIPG